MAEPLGVGGGRGKNCELKTRTEVRGRCEAGRKWGWGTGLAGLCGPFRSAWQKAEQGEGRRTFQGKTRPQAKVHRGASTQHDVQGTVKYNHAAGNSLLKNVSLTCF